jgi:MSHA biogenesis protein MshJ
MTASFSLSDLRDKFQRLTQREQLLVVLVLAAALYFLIDALVFTPQNRREQDLLDSQKALQSQLLVLSAEMTAVSHARAEDTAQKQAQLQRLKNQSAQLDALAGSVTAATPGIRRLVTEVLGAQPQRVQVVAVRTLPVKALLPSAGAPAAAGAVASAPASVTASPVYKHGVDIELRGNYLDLMGYLRSIEAAHPGLLWSNATLTADRYPENTLRVSVFLLSTQSSL